MGKSYLLLLARVRCGAVMLPMAMRVSRCAQLTPKVRELTLDGRLSAQPGQFVMVWLPGIDEKPFSLVDDDPVTLVVARVGPFSAQLHQLQVGDRVWVRGPLGRGFQLSGDRMLLVGGGYGVAPLAFLSSRAQGAKRKLAVIGAGTSGDLFFQDRLAQAGCEVIQVTEDCSAGEGGLCTDVAERLLAGEPFDVLYACGPEGMLERIQELCAELGVPGQVSKEAYMRCGLGVCGSCARDGLLVCRDGPVFSVGPNLTTTVE
ncbi:MAG TPA: dihydroorotate dehydrogenase electron transfer subunit [Chloroflexi bacterium]|nr:dihydroorotate dehydrogenase electron transfer subunit [Chloroflexota bacterium]